MKYLYSPLLRYSLLLGMLGATLSTIASLFLPNQYFPQENRVPDTTETTFKVAKAFGIQNKEEVQQHITKKEASQDFLLKAFTINSILLSQGEDMVIATDVKGGVFLYIGDFYKTYELTNVYSKKAKFKKGIHYYWAFLNPDDEKNFKENTNPSASLSKTGQSKPLRETTAKKMFEEIKYKNGTYYIPKDFLQTFSDPSTFISTIRAQVYRINNAISFKITSIKASSIFTKLGIRRGDLIVKMNNQPFTSPSQPIQLFQNLKNLKELQLTIQNQGKTKELKYEVY
ncbi:MAG: PDZ domain-containing protein [Sulfurimonas sp.]|nr:PDZ domain-containing protein [Sulfurimonas sp.]MDQ7066952.1 PDZ domain-containing protein [Sulfurimonas sp.]